MPRMNQNAALLDRQQLDAPDIVPDNVGSDVDSAGTGTEVYGQERTVQAPLAPPTEWRAMFADRAHIAWTPAVSYANADPQRGGVIGPSDSIVGGQDEPGITTQQVDGTTALDAIVPSTLKINMGMADWSSTAPQPIAIHGKINLRQNPNSPVTKPGLWSNEGTPSNTNYESPAPWAAGVYIG